MALSRSGFTMPEVLVTVAISTVALTVLMTGTGHLFRSNQHIEAISTLINLESAVVSSFASAASYSNPAVRTAMSAGVMPNVNNIVLDLCLSRQTIGNPGSACLVGFGVTKNPGQTLCLGAEGQLIQASPCDANNAAHLYQIRTDMRLDGGRYQFAYSILFNGAAARIPAMGSLPDASGGFPASAYTVSVPQNAYSDPNTFVCDPNTQYGIRGFNTLTGEVICIDRAATVCPNGTLPKRIIFDSANNEVALDCGGAAQTVSCPNSYGLARVSLGSLEAGSPKQGLCRFIARETASPAGNPYTGGGSYTGMACPPNYRVNFAASTCVATPILNLPGNCPRINWVESCGPQYLDGTDLVEDCTYVNGGALPPTVVPAAAGNAAWVPQANPRAVRCALNIPAQQCGSQWNASLTMTVSCELVAPVEGPAQ